MLTYIIYLYRIAFFTVYGPWGRPDMAYFKFTKNIINNVPLKSMEREKCIEILRILMTLLELFMK